MKYKYPALIIKDDDGFFVELPDLNHTIQASTALLVVIVPFVLLTK